MAISLALNLSLLDVLNVVSQDHYRSNAHLSVQFGNSRVGRICSWLPRFSDACPGLRRWCAEADSAICLFIVMVNQARAHHQSMLRRIGVARVG